MKGFQIALMTIFYPTEGFLAIKKDRDKFSYFAPILILCLTLYVHIAKLFIVHYPLSSVNILDVNFFQQVFSFLIPFLLWVAGNYYTTCIFNGEVKLRETFAAMCYAFLPYTILTLPIALFTNVLGIDSAGMINSLNNIIIIWVIVLVVISIREMNSYTFPQTFLVIFVSIVAVMFMAVVAVLLYVLGVKLFDFIADVVKEYRILFFG